MKRICAYMMAALFALSSVFCPVVPVLAEGEEIIDADSYGTMVEDVLTDRFHGMEPSQQEFIYVEAEDEFADTLMGTMDEEARQDFVAHVREQNDFGDEETVDVTDVAVLPGMEETAPDLTEPAVLMSSRISNMNASQGVMMTSLDDGIMTAANTSVDGLYLDKKVTNVNADGSYTIQLEAYTTGTVTTTTEYIPVDIVLVMDISGSMNSNKLGSVTRLSALKTAANKFIDSVYSQAQSHKINHRVALVTFGNGKQYKRFYDGATLGVTADNYSYTGIYNFNATNSTYSFKVYGDVVDGHCDGSALRSLYTTNTTDTTNRTILKNAVSAITTADSTATFPHLGLALANRVFKMNTIAANTKRNRVIVMFSDGGPGWNSRWFDVNAATSAINQASTAKKTYGATVYTVGVFSGANASSTGTNPGSSFTASTSYKQAVDSTAYANDLTISGKNYSWNASYNTSVKKYDAIIGNASGYKGAYTKYCNWLLQKISSNNGSVKNPSYYLSASSTTALNNVFESIANTVSNPTVDMSSSSVIKDYVSDYFKLPAGTTASNVTIRTAKYSTAGTFGAELNENCGAKASVDPDSGEVTVSGFDFNHYFCSKTKKTTGDKEYGRKLIIRFNVVPADGFLGGNNVPTNESASSGIYYGGSTPIATFPLPKVNVPLVVPPFTVEDRTVFYGQQIDKDAVLADGGLYAPYEISYNEADFVNITYIKPSSISATQCGDYDYTIQVTAKATAASTSKGTAQPTAVQTKNTNTQTAHVHVLVPEETYNDTSIYLGQTADYLDNGAFDESVYDSGSGSEGEEDGRGEGGGGVEDGTTDDSGDTGSDGSQGGQDDEPQTLHKWVDRSGHTTIPSYDAGSEPTLRFGYTPVAGAFEEDTPVNVTVQIENDDGSKVDITDVTVFKWEECSAHNGLPAIPSPHLGNVDTPEFYVHILNNSLTITKTGLNQFVYTDGSDQESAIFTVTEQGGKNRTWTVPINGDGSVTLDGLYAGATYTVTEQNGWTWRYTDTEYQDMLLEPGVENEFTFKNELEEKKWLGGDNFFNNVFSN